MCGVQFGVCSFYILLQYYGIIIGGIDVDQKKIEDMALSGNCIYAYVHVC